MLKLGFMSAIMADKTFEEVIDFAAANQFACVEIMCWPKGKAERRYAGVTHIDLAELNQDQIEYIQNYTREKGVFISGLGYYPNPLEANRENADHYISHIKEFDFGRGKTGSSGSQYLCRPGTWPECR